MYIPNNHPARVLLKRAAEGHALTSADLDMLRNVDDRLPDGQSLDTFRHTIDRAAQRITQIGATGQRQIALQEAEAALADMAGRMTPEQRAIKTTASPTERDEIDSLVERVFNN